MKLYLVAGTQYGCFDGEDNRIGIIGLYNSKEQAIKIQKANDTTFYGKLDVYEMEINKEGYDYI